MADLMTLVTQMLQDGTFTRLVRDPRAQFGTPRREYLGATILPERTVPENAYREDAIRYRTVIANDGTRYSPAQKKEGGALVGSFLVELGNSDILRELNGRDYDALLKLLQNNNDMEAMATLINFADIAVNRALIELVEKQRWDAIVNSSVVRVGDNSYTETVAYANPSGHRVAAGGTWSNNSYDPYLDILAMKKKLSDKGYTVTRIITSTTVVGILTGNTKIAQRAGFVRVLSASDVVGPVSIAQLNQRLQADGLPNIETYDLRYRTQSADFPFLPTTVMVFVATTGRDETIDWGDNSRFLVDTLGYTAIGRAVGQGEPGRVIKVRPFDNKPPRIEFEGWQTTLPVITEPEAIGVINTIS